MTSPAGASGGYSATPLAKKIGVKAGHRVWLLHRPESWQIPDLPEGATVADGDAAQDVDVTVAFYRSAADLSAEASGLVGELADQSMLWIAWPRRAAGHDSDITENLLREVFLPFGVVDVKVAALGADWSGLKFVRRKTRRASATR